MNTQPFKMKILNKIMKHVCDPQSGRRFTLKKDAETESCIRRRQFCTLRFAYKNAD
jgi:hypothetical protein